MFQSCEKNATGIKTITGVVKSIESHEEGYVVDILGNNGFTYKALVSLSNLKKQDVYRAYNIGNKISVKGEIWQLNNTYHITVKRIKE